MELRQLEESTFAASFMKNAYRIAIADQGLPAFKQELIDAVRKVTADLFGDQLLVDFSTQLSEVAIPEVVAVLVGDRFCENLRSEELIEAAIERRLAIVPVIEGGSREDAASMIPDSISHINAVHWKGDGTDAVIALLNSLGLVEKERRLFISYRRRDTAAIAEQLHTKLTQRRFDVFLDRFSIEPGVDFQHRLEEDLGDKAFLLLLESENLNESRWVQYEIAYALAKRIQIMALTFPCANRSSQVPEIDEAFRLRLGTEDVSNSESLSDQALDKVVARIELEHARALRRRREQILGSVTEKLRIEGCTCKPTGNWTILASNGSGQSGLFLASPRHPVPKDFFLLSRQRERLESSTGCDSLQTSVVHDIERLPDEYKDLLDWLSSVCGSRLDSIKSCSL